MVEMNEAVGTIYLLADSQLLFPRGGSASFAEDIRSRPPSSDACAAYIGAANGDDPAFFGIFEAAMEIAGITDRRIIRSDFSAVDAKYLARADVIILAGGDARRGAAVLSSTGMAEVLLDRHAEGATIAGVSAGAVLLGQGGWLEDPHEVAEAPFVAERVETLALVPWIVDSHDEAADWARLRRQMRHAEPYARGLGLPHGSGLVVHGDGSIEPLRKPVLELLRISDETMRTLLLPGESHATQSSEAIP